MNAIKFKGRTITKRQAINNLKRYIDLSNGDGLEWYNIAHSFAFGLSMETGINILNICGVIAALSPQTSWSMNKVFTIRFLTSNDPLTSKTGTKDRMKKALACLTAQSQNEILDILGGEKTKSFFLNLLHPEKETRVTIDRHAVAAILQRPDKTKALDRVVLTAKQYTFFEDVYKQASDQLPHKTQAVIWVQYRTQRNLTI